MGKMILRVEYLDGFVDNIGDYRESEVQDYTKEWREDRVIGRLVEKKVKKQIEFESRRLHRLESIRDIITAEDKTEDEMRELLKEYHKRKESIDAILGMSLCSRDLHYTGLITKSRAVLDSREELLTRENLDVTFDEYVKHKSIYNNTIYMTADRMIRLSRLFDVYSGIIKKLKLGEDASKLLDYFDIKGTMGAYDLFLSIDREYAKWVLKMDVPEDRYNKYAIEPDTERYEALGKLANEVSEALDIDTKQFKDYDKVSNYEKMMQVMCKLDNMVNTSILNEYMDIRGYKIRGLQKKYHMHIEGEKWNRELHRFEERLSVKLYINDVLVSKQYCCAQLSNIYK